MCGPRTSGNVRNRCRDRPRSIAHTQFVGVHSACDKISRTSTNRRCHVLPNDLRSGPTLSGMSTQSAWSVAWTWANRWWGTLRFWLAEVVVAGLAFIIVFVTTDDPSWAAAATLLAAVLTFLGGLVWKVWATTSEERRKYRAAVVRLAEATSEFPRSVDVDATNPSQMEQNVERFHTYVDEQIAKLSAVSESARVSFSGTEEFMKIARRTSSGIRR